MDFVPLLFSVQMAFSWESVLYLGVSLSTFPSACRLVVEVISYMQSFKLEQLKRRHVGLVVTV